MKITISILSALIALIGIKFIQSTAPILSPDSDKAKEEELAEIEYQNTIQENVEKYNESLRRRYESLMQEYAALHKQIQKEYQESLERRKLLRNLHPELNLPDPEKTKLIFIGNDKLVLNPTEEDIKRMDRRLKNLKNTIPNQSVDTTPASAPR